MTEDIEKYVLAHSEPEGDYLYRLYRATNIHTIHGRMASGHLQGRLLKMLVSMIRPKNILEVGTFSGYSAICMAEGLDEGGKVWTFEINDEMEDFTRPWIENSPVADKIDFRIGDANIEAPKLGVTFDLALSTATNVRMSRLTRWCYDCCAPADISLPTTRCGTAMSPTRLTTTTIRHKASDDSTTTLLPTTVLSR